MSGVEKGPIRILCDEIGFAFDRRLEREDVFLAFVEGLIDEVADARAMAVQIAPMTVSKIAPSDASSTALSLARSMVARDLGLGLSGRLKLAESIHDLSHEVNPDEPGHSADHLVDMLASCASAVRFGLDRSPPFSSSHAAAASSHVWERTYGVKRFDSHTPEWNRSWARAKLTAAIISLLPPALDKQGEDSNG